MPNTDRTQRRAEPSMLTCAASIRVRAPAPDAPGDRTVDVVASTAVLDRHGEILEQSWRLDRYLANPIVLYAHDSWSLPIGTAEDVRVEDGALRVRIRFVSAEANPQAEQVWKLVGEGALRAVSVGFLPHGVRIEKRARIEGEPDEELLVLSDLELLEISVVPVPANPEALAEIRRRALDTTPRAGGPEESPVEKKELSPEEQAKIAFADEVLAMCMELMGGEEAAAPSKALGALRGLVAGRKAADAAVTELATVKAERERERREKLLADARADGRLTPAIEQGGHWKKLADASVDTLEAALAVLPRSVPTERREPAPGPTDQLTAEDRHFARQAGLTDDDLRANARRAPTPTTSTEE